MTIHHIVLLKFKPEVSPEQRQPLWDDAAALSSKISAIQSLIIGKPVFSPPGHNYDAGVIFLFESVDKFNEFSSHKAFTDHRAFAGPYIEESLAFDIESP